MNEELNKRIRNHDYFANPMVTDFIKNRSGSTPDLTVYERRTSDINQNVEDCIDTHSNCITPVPTNRTDSECCICLSLAINPFRCSKPSEIVEQYNDKYSQVYHICCYRCVTNLMKEQNSDTIICPYCRVNVFQLNQLIPVSDEFIQLSTKFINNCEYNCGLYGNPIALAHHICPLSVPTQVGHTSQSNIVHVFREKLEFVNDQNEKLTQEIASVLRNYDIKNKDQIHWHSKYYELKRINDSHLSQMSRLAVHLESMNAINTHLKNTIKEKDLMICKLNDEHKQIIKRCKGKLKLVKKVYESKVQELEIEKQLLTNKIAMLNISSSDINSAQTSQNRDNSTDINANADYLTQNNTSMRSQAMVFFNNNAYEVPTHERESLSIIELKQKIKNLIPDWDENEHELCIFIHKPIDEDLNRNTRVVDSDNHNFILLPKRLITNNEESIPFSTVDRNLFSSLEENSD